MNSEMIVNILGSSLMGDRDNSPLGLDAEKDFKEFHKSLRYFAYDILLEEIKGFDTWRSTGSIVQKFNPDAIVKTLKELAAKHPQTMEFVTIDEDCICRLDMKSIHNISFVVYRDKYYIAMEGDCRMDELHLTCEELEVFVPKMQKTIEDFTFKIVNEGFGPIVPNKLRENYLSGIFTKDMGNSTFSTGSFSIGHEIRLRGTDTHDFVYAYLPDYFWQRQIMNRTFGNTASAYYILLRLADALPDEAEFTCQHRDDCGIELTNTNPPLEGCDLKKAVLMAIRDNGYKKLKDEDYSDILWYHNLEDKIPLTEFKAKCDVEGGAIKNKEEQIREKLGNNAQRLTIKFAVDKVEIYFIRNRDQQWTRECRLSFPYECNLDFLKDLSAFFTAAEELTKLFEDTGDIETSVGLLRKNQTMK